MFKKYYDMCCDFGGGMSKEQITIENYKKILRIANVPEILIEHPELINGIPPTKADIDWAKEMIKQHGERQDS